MWQADTARKQLQIGIHTSLRTGSDVTAGFSADAVMLAVGVAVVAVAVRTCPEQLELVDHSGCLVLFGPVRWLGEAKVDDRQCNQCIDRSHLFLRYHVTEPRDTVYGVDMQKLVETEFCLSYEHLRIIYLSQLTSSRSNPNVHGNRKTQLSLSPVFRDNISSCYFRANVDRGGQTTTTYFCIAGTCWVTQRN